MDRDERARLRALYRGIAMPWEAADHVEDGDVIATGTEIICEADDSDMGAVVVVTVDMGFDRECDEAHAALILGAVNALPALLDDSERLAKAERERDEARAEVESLRSESARLSRALDDAAALGVVTPEAAAQVYAEAALAHTDREVGEILRTLPEALRLAAEDEREACATIADEYAAQEDVAGADACGRVADAIRARGAGGAT